MIGMVLDLTFYYLTRWLLQLHISTYLQLREIKKAFDGIDKVALNDGHNLPSVYMKEKKKSDGIDKVALNGGHTHLGWSS